MGGARQLRGDLEAFFDKRGEEGINFAWRHLGDKDRFIRWAARTVLEHNGAGAWQDKAFSLTTPPAAFEALLALIRVGDKGGGGGALGSRIRTAFRQFGHVTSLPASSSLALPLSPQTGQINRMAMPHIVVSARLESE